jgi:hypothetical protein
MDNQAQLRLLSRIKSTQDGLDFLKFLEELSKKNYEEFKKATNDMNDVCKGKALALDALIELFHLCDLKLQEGTTHNLDWGV